MSAVSSFFSLKREEWGMDWDVGCHTNVVRILQSSTRAEQVAVSNHAECAFGVRGFVAVWISWLWEHPMDILLCTAYLWHTTVCVTSKHSVTWLWLAVGLLRYVFTVRVCCMLYIPMEVQHVLCPGHRMRIDEWYLCGYNIAIDSITRRCLTMYSLPVAYYRMLYKQACCNVRRLLLSCCIL